VSALKEDTSIYIIDDDESVRKGLTRLMRSVGIKCFTYGDPELFLSEVQNDCCSCIIMDISMPHLNGFELCAKLKDKGITIPVVAVSAHDDNESLRMAQDMGVKLYLRKPVDDQALLDAITWILSKECTC
jgi:FixJ family two-component response regulator